MAKHAVAAKLLTMTPPIRRNETLMDRLNRHILQTLKEMKDQADRSVDPGVEDEFEAEIFDDPLGSPPKKKK